MEKTSNSQSSLIENMNISRKILRATAVIMVIIGLLLFIALTTMAAETSSGEASLVFPDLSTVQFFGINARLFLMIGLVVCALGLLFGLKRRSNC